MIDCWFFSKKNSYQQYFQKLTETTFLTWKPAKSEYLFIFFLLVVILQT